MTIRGCLLGCLSTAGALLLFATLIGFAAWRDASAIARLPESDDPISIEGPCPEAEAVAWFEGPSHPLIRAIDVDALPTDAGAEGYLQSLRDGRAEIAAQPLAACLAGVQAATVTMLDALGDAFELVNHDEPTFYLSRLYRQAVGLLAASRAMDVHLPRVDEARTRLEQRLGIALGEERSAP